MESAIRQVAALQNESQKENIQVDVFKLMKQIISMSLFTGKCNCKVYPLPNKQCFYFTCKANIEKVCRRETVKENLQARFLCKVMATQ